MEFKKYKLSDICDLNFSSITSKDTYNNILYLDTSSITNNIIESLQTLSIKEAPSRAKRKVTHDTIIYSTVRPNLKHFGILKNPADNLIVSTGFTTIDVKDYYNEYIDADYLYLLLANQSVVDYLSTMAESAVSSYPSINPDDIGELSFYFPDIDLQRKIAATVFLLENKISLNTRLNAELEAMAKQLYDYWFVQFDFPDENGKPYKSSGGKMVYNEKLKREIPEGWEDDVLSNIANITMGQSPDGSSYNETGEGTIFYQGSTDFGIRFPSVRMYTTAPGRYAKKGDILMSVRAPVGDTNIANNDCCIGRGLSAMNSKIGSTSHLYYIIRDLKAKFDRLNAAGTTFGAINKDELFNLPVVRPNKKVLQKYEALCAPIFNKQMNIGYEIEHLTHLRDSLLPMLMNGQVVVCDDDVLYHGTDVCILEMSDEERMQFFSDCKLVIQALYEQCKPIESYRTCCGWAFPLFKFFRNEKEGWKENPLTMFSKIEKRGLYLTNCEAVAEDYAEMAQKGGEMGLVAYTIIKKSEERNIEISNKEIKHAIERIKHFVEDRKHEPIVVKLEYKDLDVKYLECEEKLDISGEVECMHNLYFMNPCYNFKYLKLIDLHKYECIKLIDFYIYQGMEIIDD